MKYKLCGAATPLGKVSFDEANAAVYASTTPSSAPAPLPSIQNPQPSSSAVPVPIQAEESDEEIDEMERKIRAMEAAVRDPIYMANLAELLSRRRAEAGIAEDDEDEDVAEDTDADAADGEDADAGEVDVPPEPALALTPLGRPRRAAAKYMPGIHKVPGENDIGPVAAKKGRGGGGGGSSAAAAAPTSRGSGRATAEVEEKEEEMEVEDDAQGSDDNDDDFTESAEDATVAQEPDGAVARTQTCSGGARSGGGGRSGGGALNGSGGAPSRGGGGSGGCGGRSRACCKKGQQGGGAMLWKEKAAAPQRSACQSYANDDNDECLDADSSGELDDDDDNDAEGGGKGAGDGTSDVGGGGRGTGIFEDDGSGEELTRTFVLSCNVGLNIALLVYKPLAFGGPSAFAIGGSGGGAAALGCHPSAAAAAFPEEGPPLPTSELPPADPGDAVIFAAKVAGHDDNGLLKALGVPIGARLTEIGGEKVVGLKRSEAAAAAAVRPLELTFRTPSPFAESGAPSACTTTKKRRKAP